MLGNRSAGFDARRISRDGKGRWIARDLNEPYFSARLVIVVHARIQAGVSIVSLLLAQLVFRQASRETAVKAPVPNSTNGTIVLGGGYFDNKETAALLRRVIDLAGGPAAFLVIIPTADPQLEPAVRTGSPTSLIDYEQEAKLRFAGLGVKHVKVLHTGDRAVADSDEFARPLRSANCVWIPGGDPELLFKVYPNTAVQRELQGILDRGGLIAGDSAGALVIGQGLLAVDVEGPTRIATVREGGLRLLRNAFVMPHVNRYQAGIAELGCKTFVSAHPEMLAILIEENTAVMVQRDQVARLLGSGRAGIVDGRNHVSDSAVWLSGSTRYDLRRRVLVQ